MVAKDFCARAPQNAECVKQIADALRQRASQNLRPAAKRIFSTSVEIDGQPRAFEVLEGQHPMDAAILFCRTHASGNAGCAAQLAGAVPPSASLGSATMAERLAAEQIAAAEAEAARIAAEQKAAAEAEAARIAAEQSGGRGWARRPPARAKAEAETTRIAAEQKRRPRRDGAHCCEQKAAAERGGASPQLKSEGRGRDGAHRCRAEEGG